MDKLFIDIVYPVEHPGMTISSNIKESKQSDIIREFLRSQLGVGVDHNPPQQREEYHITLVLDLSGDSFSVSSDTGNCGLRDGILMDVARRLDKRKL